MKYEHLELDVPNGNGEGAAKPIERHRIKSVYVDGTFTANVNVEISPEKVPTTWWKIHTFTSKGVLTFEHACRWVRITIDTYVGGTPNALFGGYDVV